MDYGAFAQDWQDAWNSHDLTRILSHYSAHITFCSPKAQVLVGTGVVQGKPALTAYWAKALAAQPDLAFNVQNVFHGHRMMVITYTNHRGVLAAETLIFDVDGRVVQASACHAPTAKT